MKKWTIYAAVLFLAACSLEETPVVDPKPSISDETPAVTLNITFPATGSPHTKTITEAKDSIIDKLYVLVFKEAGTVGNLLDDTFEFTVDENDVTITDGGTDDGNIIKNVKFSIKTSPDERRFVLLANLPSNLDTYIKALTAGTTENTIIDALKFDASAWQSGDYIPMFGHMDHTVVIDQTYNPVTQPITINMIRSLAKIDVIEEPLPSSKFAIQEVYIYKVSESGYVAPNKEQYLKNAPQPARIEITNTDNATIPRIPITAPYSFNFTNKRGVIYVPETDSLIENTCEPAFLIIKAQYDANKNNVYDSDEMYYYRVDFTSANTYVPLLRNHHYTMKIVDIKAKGYTKIADAEEEPCSTLNFPFVIEGEPSINDISVYNDQYLLGLSTNEVIFDWEKKLIGGQTDYYEVNVLSTYNADWEAKWNDHTNFDVTPTSAGKNTNVLKITALNMNYTGLERSTTITLTAGLITKEITVRQTGGANCAVLKFKEGETESSVNIPLAFVESARPDIFNGRDMSHLKAKVIWQEKTGNNVAFKAKLSATSGPIANQWITVHSAAVQSNKYSNAVVALLWENPGGPGSVGSVEPDRIVWSWHVWSMPAADASNTYGGDVNTDFHNPNQSLLMKRVLGKGYLATSRGYDGLYYQWGRKDPFMQDAALFGVNSQERADTLINFDHDTKYNTLSEAIMLPTTFFKNTDYGGAGDWMYTPYGNAWNGSDGKKTPNDPCPEGWRVPLHYTSADETPWKNDVTAYSQVARSEFQHGYLHSATLGVNDLSTGFLWTASPHNDGGAYYVQITNSAVTPSSGSERRASGYSVRCVKDLKRKF
jgi:hypothetical protein